ncbi:MAG: DUF488 domain-containing protein [Marmoricola sp.]
MPAPLLTFGHGRLSADELAALVAGAGVERVVDVRRFPGSRANEAAARGAVPGILERSDIGYRWEERLGGRRHLRKDEPCPDTWWQVAAFRAYAAWTRTPDFAAGLATLLTDVGERRTAIMCSEAVWWRCHRRIISDVVLLLHGIEVEHLMHTGALVSHRPSEGARVVSDELVWDLPA